MSILFITFVALLGFLTLNHFERSFRQSLMVEQSALVSTLADSIDHKLEIARAAVEAAALSVSSRHFDDAEAAQAFLDDRLSLRSIFDNGLFLIGRDGKLVAESPFLKGRRGRDLSFREYFQQTIRTQKSFISEVYISTHTPGHPAVFVSVPVLNKSGQMIGILGGSFDLHGKNMLEKLSSMRIGKTGYIYVADANRKLIVHADRSRIMQIAAAPGVNKLFDQAIAGSDVSGETINSRNLHLLSSFKHLTATNWVVAANYPIKEAYEPLYKARRYFLVALLFSTIIALSTVWLVARHVTAPVASLTDHVQRSLASSWTPVSVNSNDELGTLSIAFNSLVSSLQLHQAALLQSDKKFRLLFEDAPLAYQSLDADARFLQVNRAWCEALGYERDEIIGRWFGDFMSPTSAALIKTNFPKFRDSGEIHSVVFEMVKKDGTHFLASFDGKIGYDEQGMFQQTHCIFVDITERQRAEVMIRQMNAELEQRVKERTAELEHANQELESFCYSVSHDLRTPLRGINGFTRILFQDYHQKLDDAGKEYLQRAGDAAVRMGHLIDDLLTLSRVSRCAITRQVVNVTNLVEEIALELRQREPDRRVVFRIAQGATAFGDNELLGLVVENLLENAWKFTAKKAEGVIEFGTAEAGDQQIFFVRDNGAGFNMIYADKLFEPFQRLHGAEFEGTGVGLASVQRIISRHGGRTWGEGEIEHGATFFFSISRHGGQ
jgi:PAS domain S-box-containing protein